jgi:hypothetical protein
VAAYNKFDQFVEDLLQKVHDLFGTAGSTADVCKVVLTNSAPVSTNTVLANITQISGTNGYTTGGTSVANAGTRSTGTVTVNGTNVTWTASGGTIGPFEYVVLYNDTPTSPADPLVAWWDYGSALTLNDGESFTVKFNNGASNGTIFTLA